MLRRLFFWTSGFSRNLLFLWSKCHVTNLLLDLSLFCVMEREPEARRKRRRVAYRPRRGIYPAAGPRTMMVARRAGFTNVRTGGYMDMEKKFVDYEMTDDAFTTTWSVMEDATADCISAVSQGDGESQRDGRTYHIRSLHMKFFVSRASAESATNPPVDMIWRILVVLDKQTNGAQLTATDVMDAGGTDDVLSFRNLQFTRRFQVLADMKGVLKPQMVNEGAINLFANGISYSHPRSFNRTFKTPLKVTTSGTTAVIAAIQDYSIHVIGISTSTSCLLSYASRLRFSG